MEIKICENCGSNIPKKVKHLSIRKYCNKKCSREFYRKNYRSQNPLEGMGTDKIGKINEMLVCIDLIKKKYEVYTKLGSSSFGILILKNNKIMKISVTTGHFSPSGKLVYYTGRKDGFDILAVVTPKGIQYFPEFDE